MSAGVGDEITVETDTVGRLRRRVEAAEVLTRTATTGPTSALRGDPVRLTVSGVAATDPIRTIMATSVATVDGGASLRVVAEDLAEAEVGALSWSAGACR